MENLIASLASVYVVWHIFTLAFPYLFFFGVSSFLLLMLIMYLNSLPLSSEEKVKRAAESEAWELEMAINRKSLIVRWGGPLVLLVWALAVILAK